MRGWGRARDNSTIVQGGVGGQAPRGRKLALFPCTEAGPWLAGRAGSILEETGAELIAGAQVALSPNTTFHFLQGSLMGYAWAKLLQVLVSSAT